MTTAATHGAETRVAPPYLVSWRLAGRKVVIVGGGSMGEDKVDTLLPCEADLLVVDPAPTPRVQELADAGRIRLASRRFCPLDFFRASLVIAATGDSATNQRIRRYARLAGALVNAVDEPALCDVTIPSVVRRGPATIAISTNGASPAAARFLREELTRLLPIEVGHVLDHAAAARADLRSTDRYRYDYPEWRDRFFVPAMQAIRDGRTDRLSGIRARFVTEFSRAPDPTASPAPARVVA